MNNTSHTQEVAGLYKIHPLTPLRRTKGVYFDAIDPHGFAHIDAIDRVIHEGGAFSPSAIGNVERPWYMHPHQDDNLIVLHGVRHVNIYTKAHGRVESFEVYPNMVKKDGESIYDGPAMLVWPRGVFHQIETRSETGSASMNFAVHYEGFDITDNFNIYDLNTQTGEHRVIREGHLDQNV